MSEGGVWTPDPYLEPPAPFVEILASLCRGPYYFRPADVAGMTPWQINEFLRLAREDQSRAGGSSARDGAVMQEALSRFGGGK